MRVLSDFGCECGKKTEEFIDNSVSEIDCECGKKSHRLVSAHSYFKIDGFRMDINSDAWAKARVANGRRTHG